MTHAENPLQTHTGDIALNSRSDYSFVSDFTSEDLNQKELGPQL